MTSAPSVLAVVPARGGSKGLPRKNILAVQGRPLIAWTLQAARDSTVLDRVIVSTDDEEIAAAAAEHGGDVPFLRPAELARDDTTTHAVVLHALEQLGPYDYVVVLQPTSPLRTGADIDGAVRACISAGAPSCVSVCVARESPYWMYALGDDSVLLPLMAEAEIAHRRQDLPVVYRLNGAVYVANTAWLREREDFVGPGTIAYVMPPERSLDIDTGRDLRLLDVQLEG